MLPYDWHSVFSSTLVLNTNANNKDLALDFPGPHHRRDADGQAGDGRHHHAAERQEKEKFEYVPLAASSNQFPGISIPFRCPSKSGTTFRASGRNAW